MDLKVGCTGWSYRSWSGRFYPKNLEQKRWLQFYSSIFDITEVNSSFYRIPSSAVTRKWNNDTPCDFRFTLKFPKSITHDSRLNFEKCRDDYHSFIINLEPLKQKISVLVFQLPPSLTFDECQTKLDIISKHLPNYFRYAIEGRHESWFEKNTLEYLRCKKWCLVWNEVPMVDNPAPVTTDFVYLRMIGDRIIPDDSYGKIVREQRPILEKWSSKIKKISENSDIKQAFVLLNNHLEGFSPNTANRFRGEMGLEMLEFKDKNQKMIF